MVLADAVMFVPREGGREPSGKVYVPNTSADAQSQISEKEISGVFWRTPRDHPTTPSSDMLADSTTAKHSYQTSSALPFLPIAEALWA